MARINGQSFYVNLVSMSREEAAITLAILLSTYCASDEDLRKIGKAIGIEEPVRPLLDSVGSKIDEDWPEMLAKTLAILEDN